MDILDWYLYRTEKAKTDVVQACVDRIAMYAFEYTGYGYEIEDPTLSPKTTQRVKILETDGGILFGWLRGSNIYHLLVPDNGEKEILVRGEENWPRGSTRRFDMLIKMIDGQLNNDREAEDIAFGNFREKFPIIEVEIAVTKKSKRIQNDAPTRIIRIRKRRVK
ncbi:MAG: hypothetical protein QQN63_13415, partial [Nitrosopumilus sp.]